MMRVQPGIVKHCWNEIFLTVTNVRASLSTSSLADQSAWPAVEECEGPTGMGLVGAFADLYEQLAAECQQRDQALREGEQLEQIGFGSECEYFLKMNVLGGLVGLLQAGGDCPRGLLALTVGLLAGLCRHAPPALLLQDGMARAISQLLRLLTGIKPNTQTPSSLSTSGSIGERVEATLAELGDCLGRQLIYYPALALAIDYAALVDLMMARLGTNAAWQSLLLKLVGVGVGEGEDEKRSLLLPPLLQADLPLKLCTHLLSLPNILAEGWLQFCDACCHQLGDEAHVMVAPWRHALGVMAGRGFRDWRSLVEHCSSPELVIPVVQQWQKRPQQASGEEELALEEALFMAALCNHPVDVTGLFGKKTPASQSGLWKASSSVHLAQLDCLFRLYARLPWQLQGGGSREECSLLYGRHLSLAEEMLLEVPARPWHGIEMSSALILRLLSSWWSNSVKMNLRLTEYCLQWASCPDPLLIQLQLLPRLLPILEQLISTQPANPSPDSLLIATQQLLADAKATPFAHLLLNTMEDPASVSIWLLGHLTWQLAAHLQVHASRSYTQLIYE